MRDLMKFTTVVAFLAPLVADGRVLHRSAVLVDIVEPSLTYPTENEFEVGAERENTDVATFPTSAGDDKNVHISGDVPLVRRLRGRTNDISEIVPLVPTLPVKMKKDDKNVDISEGVPLARKLPARINEISENVPLVPTLPAKTNKEDKNVNISEDVPLVRRLWGRTNDISENVPLVPTLPVKMKKDDKHVDISEGVPLARKLRARINYISAKAPLVPTLPAKTNKEDTNVNISEDVPLARKLRESIDYIYANVPLVPTLPAKTNTEDKNVDIYVNVPLVPTLPAITNKENKNVNISEDVSLASLPPPRETDIFEGVELLGLVGDLNDACSRLPSDLQGFAPVLESTVQTSDSTSAMPKYTIDFVNISDPKDVKTAETTDPTFATVRGHFHNITRALQLIQQRALSPKADDRRALSSIDVAPTVNSQNINSLLRSLQSLLAFVERTPDMSTLSNLQYALALQMFLNFGRKVFNVAVDVIKFGSLVKLGMIESALRPAEDALNGVKNVLGAVGKVGSVVGYVFMFVNFVFDIYHLSQATTESERNHAIVGVVFDIIYIGLTAVSLAAVTGASVIGTLGGVPLTGLSICIGALVDAFAAVAGRAAHVGQYFGKLKEGFEGDVYHFDDNRRALPNPYLVIEEINFQTNTIVLGSPYLSKSIHGWPGSGRSNYYFWAWSKPECNHRWYTMKCRWHYYCRKVLTADWRKHVFDLGKRMEDTFCKKCTHTHKLPANFGVDKTGQGSAPPSVFVLPISPRSIISYDYMILPFATGRGDYGFDALRNLEGDDFDFDFYVFPSEFIIDSMRHMYLDTHVRVVMDGTHRVLAAPKHEQQQKNNAYNKLYYHIVGHSTAVTDIILQCGVNFFLESADNHTASFVLDSTYLEDHPPWALTFSPSPDKKIYMGETWIDYTDLPLDSTVWIRSTEGLGKLDMVEPRILTVSIFLPPNATVPLNTVQQKVDNFTRQYPAADRFIAILGHVKDAKRDDIDHVFYDTTENMFVYTDGATPADTTLWGVQSKEFGCFASSSQCHVWCTNVNTHKIIFETILMCGGGDKGSAFELGSFSFIGEQRVLVESRRVRPSPGGHESLHYLFLLSQEEVVLVQVIERIRNGTVSGDVRAAMNLFTDLVSSQSHKDRRASLIGENPMLDAQQASWVAYESLVDVPDATSRQQQYAPISNQQAWYSNSTNTTICPRMGTGPLPSNLIFMPLSAVHMMVGRSATHRKKENAEVLFYDASSAQVFRYEPDVVHGERGELVDVRGNITAVSFFGTAWLGVTTEGSVVEFASTQNTRIVGYILRKVFTNDTFAPQWWTSRRAEDKTNAPIIPFYAVEESGLIKAVRSWYIPKDDVYVIMDPDFREHDTVHCVGVTANEIEALVASNGTLWRVQVVHPSDITAHSGTLRSSRQQTAVSEWMPSKRMFLDYGERIIGAQWIAGGMALETNSGLAILVRNLTTTSAEFILAGLHVQGDESEDYEKAARKAYGLAVSLGVRMPEENFVSTWKNSAQGYMVKVGNAVRFLRPHRGVPLGVSSADGKMLLFDSSSDILWSDNIQLNSTFEFAERTGALFSATSSSQRVHIPTLVGVQQVVILLRAGVKEVVFPLSDEVKEIDIETMDENVTIRVHLPWGAQGWSTHDTSDMVQLLMKNNNTLRWKGRPRQHLILAFSGNDTGIDIIFKDINCSAASLDAACAACAGQHNKVCGAQNAVGTCSRDGKCVASVHNWAPVTTRVIAP